MTNANSDPFHFIQQPPFFSCSKARISKRTIFP